MSRGWRVLIIGFPVCWLVVSAAFCFGKLADTSHLHLALFFGSMRDRLVREIEYTPILLTMTGPTRQPSPMAEIISS